MNAGSAPGICRTFSGYALGATLLEALVTPTWKWKNSAILEAKPLGPSAATSAVQYVDVAPEAGLTIPNTLGGIDHKRLIIEAKGSGIAFF
jgi:enediyne biosynthesis protein E4